MQVGSEKCPCCGKSSHLPEVVGALAGGGRIVLNDGPELRMPGPSVGGLWDQLCRDGWLEPMANGGTFKLSDAGLLAYLRSTDELGDGKLISPREAPTPKDPHPCK